MTIENGAAPDDTENGQSSMLDTMSAAFDAAQARDDGDESSTTSATERTRDAGGRFAANGTDQQAETSQVEAGAQETVQAVVEPVAPPHSWSQAAKEQFSKLPPDMQKAIAEHETEREKGINAKLQESHAARQFSEAVMQVASPYMPMIQAEGGNVITAMQSLLNTAYQMRQDPKGTILQLAHQYGVDLSDVSTQQPESVDPVLAETQKRLQMLESYIHQNAQQQQQAEQASAQQEVNHFLTVEKPPYFEEVRQDMIDLLRMGKANDLKSAYSKAVRMNESVFAKITAEKAAAEAKAKADAALKASAVNISKRGAPPAAAAKGSMLDTMQATYDRLMAS